MRHKHADLMIALANDSSLVIELKRVDGSWHGVLNPCFDPSIEYRIKPQDEIRYMNACLSAYAMTTRAFPLESGNDNLRLTFDGDSGALKSAEVIK